MSHFFPLESRTPGDQIINYFYCHVYYLLFLSTKKKMRTNIYINLLKKGNLNVKSKLNSGNMLIIIIFTENIRRQYKQNEKWQNSVFCESKIQSRNLFAARIIVVRSQMTLNGKKKDVFLVRNYVHLVCNVHPFWYINHENCKNCSHFADLFSFSLLQSNQQSIFK